MENKVHFDLTEGGKYTHGTLEFSDGILKMTDGGSEKSFDISEYDELIMRSFVGIGEIELKPKNTEDTALFVPVCRFTMAHADELGELCKVVNFYIITGEETYIKESDIPVCPKCGRHYMKGLSVCVFCAEKSYLFKRSFKMFRPYYGKTAVALILLIAANILNALIPVLNSRMLDGYLYAEGIELSIAKKGVILITLAICGSQVLNQLLQILSKRITAAVSSDYAHDFRLKTYEKLQRMSLTAHAKRTTGDLMRRVTRDTEQIKNFITEDGLHALNQLLLLTVVLVILFAENAVLTLIALIPVPLGIFIFYCFRRTIHIRFDRQWRAESRSNSILHDIVRGIRVVKSFGNEKNEIAKFSRACKRVADISISNERLWAKTFPYVTFLIGAGEFLVLYFGGKMVINGTLSTGSLLEFTLYLAYIYGPINFFSRLPQRLANVSTSMTKVFEIIDEKEDMPRTSDTKPGFENSIVFENVRFGYKSYEPVLKDINLTVKKGEMIGLVGRSGAGKSTLINLIMRLYDVNSGRILIDGKDIRELDAEAYRNKIAVVFQETILFGGTVYENIAYAKDGATPEEIIKAAKIANAHDFIMKLPDGYNTYIGENGHTLSGGEKQRIAIARAVLRDPEILILDEATSALDTETEKSIREALDRLTQNRTTFAIAHRLSTLQNADRLVVIDKGKIAEVGPHRDLLLKGGIYANLVMAQRKTARLKK